MTGDSSVRQRNVNQSSQNETKKPDNSAFKQQRLPAWQPVLTAKSVLPEWIHIFFFIFKKMKFYVVADDFGYCPERNRAILVGFNFLTTPRIVLNNCFLQIFMVPAENFTET